jgi:hypothetical protein
MPRLFPQLIAGFGKQAADELASMTVRDAFSRAEARADDVSSMCIFAATGGTRITPQELIELRKEVIAAAREHGFPDGSQRDQQRCDARIAVILRDKMDISPAEAATDGIWEYLACILMPDIVIWRFGDSGTSKERFLGGRRNNFHRLWWRAYVLAGHLSAGDAQVLLGFMGEDEFVQIMERPNLFGHVKAMRLYCMEFRKAVQEAHISARRSDVNREVHKRLLRKCAVVALESLTEGALREELVRTIRDADASLLRMPRGAAGRAPAQ